MQFRNLTRMLEKIQSCVRRVAASVLSFPWEDLRSKLWVMSCFCFGGALQAIQVKEYACAIALFHGSAVSLIVFAYGWTGIVKWPRLTIASRLAIGVAGSLLIPLAFL